MRFKGFEGEYKNVECKEISKIFGVGVDKIKKQNERKVQFVNFIDVYKNRFLDNQLNLLETTCSDEEFNKYELHFGDILITPSSENKTDIGLTSVINFEPINLVYSYHLNLIRFYLKIIEPLWISYYFSTSRSRKYFYKVSSGITRYTLNKKDLEKFKISYPSIIEEQIKISKFLKLLDKQILLLENKLKLTEQLKDYYINSLFANKNSIPKLRFREFTQNLENFNLKDFGESNGGTSLEKFFNKTGKYKVINIGSYTNDNKYRDQGIRIDLNDKSKNKILNKNDLVMVLNDKTPSGNIIGRVILIDENNKYVYNQRSQRIIVKKEFDSKFLFYFLNQYNNRKKIIARSKGNTQIYINWKDIETIKYFVPTSLKEQEKISKFFYLLDKQIENIFIKIEINKNIKKYFLNNLFI